MEHSWIKRLLWLAAIWGASVLALGAVSMIFRLLMNAAGKGIDKVRISRGGNDQTTADVRSILREALLQRATQIALIHNHPSGNPHPSNDDQRLTELVRKAAQTMNIHLTDHVIVTDGSHYSFNDDGLL